MVDHGQAMTTCGHQHHQESHPPYGGGGEGKGGGDDRRTSRKTQCQDMVKISKRLCWLLRHRLHEIPEADSGGFIPVPVLLQRSDFQGVTLEDLERLVTQNEKQRFTMETRADGQVYIRANQGHSHKSGQVVDPEMVYTKITEPLPYCVHGTSRKAYESIRESGLNRMSRTHIHFASSPEAKSGFRATSTVLIHVNMNMAMNDGIDFFLSSNGVILSEGHQGSIGPQYFTQVEIR